MHPEPVGTASREAPVRSLWLSETRHVISQSRSLKRDPHPLHLWVPLHVTSVARHEGSTVKDLWQQPGSTVPLQIGSSSWMAPSGPLPSLVFGTDSRPGDLAYPLLASAEMDSRTADGWPPSAGSGPLPSWRLCSGQPERAAGPGRVRAHTSPAGTPATFQAAHAFLSGDGAFSPSVI